MGKTIDIILTVAYFFVFVVTTYPVEYSVCGVTNTIQKAPSRIITMNQGATEFLLALGLAERMVGTAYLDDDIWPQYKNAFNNIPILSTRYPDEINITNTNPDFMVASYSSAFRQKYVDDKGRNKGIFSDATVGPCTGRGSEWGMGIRATCRPQLHRAGIGTYLFADHCEDSSLRPTAVSKDIVYRELRTMGSIFNVDPEPLIALMKSDFEKAGKLISDNAAALDEKPFKVVWLDCINCCDKGVDDEPTYYVGGGTGAPHLLMKEAGLTNAFENKQRGWVCVKQNEIVAADPDAIVLVDADWDKAKTKVETLYNDVEFCKLNAVTRASFVKIPFSATTLSPRNGQAALDLAVVSLHVRLGIKGEFGKSGVGFFDVETLVKYTENSTCPLQLQSVPYAEGTLAIATTPITTPLIVTTPFTVTTPITTSFTITTPVSTTTPITITTSPMTTTPLALIKSPIVSLTTPMTLGYVAITVVVALSYV